MSHHLEDLLEELKTRVARMSTLVYQAVEQSCEAVFQSDEKLARETIALDERIDDEEVKVEQSAINVLALQQPAAVDLRTVTTIIKVNADFERIADCAVNIAQRVLPLAQWPK
jgi:phosphate transport system protein